MRSTMQDVPLSVSRITRYATTIHAGSEAVTWTGERTRRTSYGELGRRAARLANGLRTLGVRGDARIGTFMWNNSEHLEAYATIPSMGAVLHTLNIRLSPDQLVYIVNHAADEVVIVDGALIAQFAPQLSQLKTVKHVLVSGPGDRAPLLGTHAAVHDYEDLLAAQSDDFDFEHAVADVDETDAAAVCYTSGTTGNPKGVAYSHRSIYLHSMFVISPGAFGISRNDRVLAVVPMFHAMSWGLPYAALMCGASLHLPDRFLQPEPLASFISTEKPTVGSGVPTVWNALQAYLDAHEPRVDVSSLRDVVVGGSACPPALMTGLEERHGVRLLHAWGMTETSPIGSVARPPGDLPAEDSLAYRLTQGLLPCPVEGRIVDDQGAVLASDGRASGELEVRGPWVTGSYLDNPAMPDPEASTAKFRDGWLRTGDVASISSDGFVTLTDRAKDVIKSGGEWISSVDLENALMGHPEVVEAAVIGIPDPRWEERPLAAVVPRAGADVTFEELRDYLAGKVARWQLPEHWARIDEVPKTSVGKFDKKVLRALHSAGDLQVTTIGGAR